MSGSATVKSILNALLFPMLAGFCVVPADAAGRETFDTATFTAPPGWERVAIQGMVSFRTPASPQGFAQIFIFPSKPSAGNPQANFQAEWKRLVTTPLGAAPPAQLNTDQTPSGWTAVSGAVDVTREKSTFAVLLITATGQERMASVVVNLAGQAHLAEVETFFRQLEFRVGAAGTPPGSTPQRPAESAAPPASPASSAASLVPIPPAGFDKNRPVGLFHRNKVNIQSGGRLESETRVFLPGSRIVRVFPFGGGDTFDPSARCNPDTCGSYQLDAGTLTVRWDNGRVDRWAYATSAEGITLDGTLFKPARPITEAALIGEWTGSGDSGNAFSNVYRFERGGTFTFGTGQKPGAPGRYRVQGLALILAFADGSESRRTLFAAGTGEPVGLISVEGEVYKRK